MRKIIILGIAGSLRKDSYNKAALCAAQNLVPKNAEIEIFDRLSEIPPFNQDKENNMPKVILELKEKIAEADAILIATPEYNYSFPGVLKNAIDWASRPYGKNAWEGKPVALLSAASGMLGGARAQYHLRQVFVFLNMYPLNKPEVIIPFAHEKFDQKGNLIDQYTKEKIQELVNALVVWTLKLKEKETEKLPEIAEKYPYQLTYKAQEEREAKRLDQKGRGVSL